MFVFWLHILCFSSGEDADSFSELALAITLWFVVLNRIDWPGRCKLSSREFPNGSTPIRLQIILLLAYFFLNFTEWPTQHRHLLMTYFVVARDGPFLRPKETFKGTAAAMCSLESPSWQISMASSWAEVEISLCFFFFPSFSFLLQHWQIVSWALYYYYHACRILDFQSRLGLSDTKTICDFHSFALINITRTASASYQMNNQEKTCGHSPNDISASKHCWTPLYTPLQDTGTQGALELPGLERNNRELQTCGDPASAYSVDRYGRWNIELF